MSALPTPNRITIEISPEGWTVTVRHGARLLAQEVWEIERRGLAHLRGRRLLADDLPHCLELVGVLEEMEFGALADAMGEEVFYG